MQDQTESPLILDTHGLIWLLEGISDLSGSVFVEEAEAASADGRLMICSITLAEVGLLVARGVLRFVVPVSAWLAEALQTPGLQVIPIDANLATEGSRLPAPFPGDAADRLIVAATRLCGGRLATADQSLQEYARQGYLSILPIAQPRST